MVKKIIFDIDNTLIMTDKSNIKDYQNILRKYNSDDSFESALELYKCIGAYEVSVSSYKKETLLNFINDYFDKNYTIDLVNDIVDVVSNWCNPVSEELIEALEYLSSKYDLYILTNWFITSQKKRLDKVGISHYFKEFVGSEESVKPLSSSFEYFFQDCKASECVVIGDRFDIDIEMPLKLGMKAILYDYKNRYQELDCIKIVNWKEIKNIL